MALSFAPAGLIRRARPWLGTLVEIAVLPSATRRQAQSSMALAAIDFAFAAIARVDASMSFQNTTSELSQYNQLEPGQWLAAGDDLLAVLAFSIELSAKTQGVFDVCCDGADWQSVIVDKRRKKLAKLAPLTVDTSGVAKGYAVDCGVSALQACGIESGWINAGGDVQVFGGLSVPLHVRSPGNAAQLHDFGFLQNSAAATSASYFVKQAVLRHGVSREFNDTLASWTVCAPSCMVADALTKVLAVSNNQAPVVFEEYGAQGWVLN